MTSLVLNNRAQIYFAALENIKHLKGLKYRYWDTKNH